jgi:glycosyltransferase involved in cell wall biosynthesis
MAVLPPPLKAMQCGLPVLCSHRSSLPEVVGDSGILLDPLDGGAWASAILELYSNSNLSNKLRTKGIETAIRAIAHAAK